jgi:hypothetical protein
MAAARVRGRLQGGTEMIRRILLCSLFAIALAGCQNIVGPFQREDIRADDPRLPISEQKRLGRAYLGITEESYLSGPHTGGARQDNPGK